MKTLLLLLLFFFFLFLLLFFLKRTKGKEGFASAPGSIVLIGDSVLRNESYVGKNESVAAILTQLGRYHVRNYAQDGATIQSTLTQINHIPENNNNNNGKDIPVVFLSVGGNDMLQMRRKTEQKIQQLFDTYIGVVQDLQNKFPNSSIYLLNMYLPPDPKFEESEKYVLQWNKLLAEMTCCKVVDIYSQLNTANDFTHQIEPSFAGGKRIVGAMLLAI